MRVRAGRTDLTERTPEKDSRSQLSIFVALDVSVHSLIRREENLCLVMFSQNMGPIIEIYKNARADVYKRKREILERAIGIFPFLISLYGARERVSIEVSGD